MAQKQITGTIDGREVKVSYTNIKDSDFDSFRSNIVAVLSRYMGRKRINILTQAIHSFFLKRDDILVSLDSKSWLLELNGAIPKLGSNCEEKLIKLIQENEPGLDYDSEVIPIVSELSSIYEYEESDDLGNCGSNFKVYKLKADACSYLNEDLLLDFYGSIKVHAIESDISEKISSEDRIILDIGGTRKYYLTKKNDEPKWIRIDDSFEKYSRLIFKEYGITDEDFQNVCLGIPKWIPSGFWHYDGSIDTGYVITDKYQNEYVYLPFADVYISRYDISLAYRLGSLIPCSSSVKSVDDILSLDFNTPASNTLYYHQLFKKYKEYLSGGYEFGCEDYEIELLFDTVSCRQLADFINTQIDMGNAISNKMVYNIDFSFSLRYRSDVYGYGNLGFYDSDENGSLRLGCFSDESFHPDHSGMVIRAFLVRK